MRRRLGLGLAVCALLAASRPAAPDPGTDASRQQAYEALTRDAWRRERRFLAAVDPSSLLRATRIAQADLDEGRWTSEALYRAGEALFQHTFTRAEGFGARDLPALARFHKGRRGGPDARSCATCHWRGGPAGAGDGADNAYLDGDGETLASGLERNPLALSGAGVLELLAAEMSRELAAQRTALLATARAHGRETAAPLSARGVGFGELRARPDGTLDASRVAGVAPDLVIRPFGWKGNLATLRDAVEDELLVHIGLQSSWLATHGARERVGPFPAPDPDGDGVRDELSEGQVSALTLFVAMQPVPEIIPPRDTDLVVMWARGRTRFDSLGCAQCHVPSLPLESAVYTLPSRAGKRPLRLDLARAGVLPASASASAAGKPGHHVELFSDLKWHDLGPELREPRGDRGVSGERFLTRPLWGLARSQPYLHDGRAPTLEDAILLHGGEARAARDRYAALPEAERATVRVFLTSLTRARRLSVP